MSELERTIEQTTALRKALAEAVQWHRQTADGTDWDIERIYGRETMKMVKRWEALLAGVTQEVAP